MRRWMKNNIAWAILFAMILSFVPVEASYGTILFEENHALGMEGDELIVRFKPEALKGFSVMSEVHASAGSKVKKNFKLVPGLSLVQIEEGTTLSEAMEYYRNNPHVLYVEPNYPVYAMDVWEQGILGEKTVYDKMGQAFSPTPETTTEYVYETEPNNLPSEANMINDSYAGQPYYRLLGHMTNSVGEQIQDYDYFQFGLTKAGRMGISSYWTGELYEQGVEEDLVLAVSDVNGNLLVTADLYGQNETEYQYGWVDLEAGTYYISITATHDANISIENEDYVIDVNFTPLEDYDFNHLWGLENTGQTIDGTTGTIGADISILDAWVVEKGSDEVVIAVIDTGVAYEHPLLAQNMWESPEGYYGKNFVDSSALYDPMDDNGHGTHVAGTIAGYKDGIVTGVMQDASIMALKVLDSRGIGNTADIIEAVEYANQNGAQVINMSLGGPEYSQGLYDAMALSSAVIVVAAGNAGEDIGSYPTYPASFGLPNMLVVGNSNNLDQLAETSNYGQEEVDVMAPGTYIFSTGITGFQYLSGTSMAAPHVAGIAGLIFSQDSSLTHVEVISQMKEHVDVFAALQFKLVTQGRVNAREALYNLMTHDYAAEQTLTEIVAQMGDTHLVIDISDFATALAVGAGDALFDLLTIDPDTLIRGDVQLVGVVSNQKFMDFSTYHDQFDQERNSMQSVVDTEGQRLGDIVSFQVFDGFDAMGQAILTPIQL